MNLGKLTNIVLGAIKSRKDKTNKITQLAMAINGTYVEDTTYVDDRIQWLFGKSEDEFSVQYSNISKIVEKINSLKSGEAGLFLTEKQASKFSILAGLTGVQIMDLSQKEAYDMYGSHFAAMGVDITGIVLAVDFTIGELDNNTKFTYNGVEYTLLPAEEEPTVTAPIFNSIDQVGESSTNSSFQLGDNMIFNHTQGNELLSPCVVFFTQEQRSKISVSAELNTDTFTQEDFAQGVFDDDLTALGQSLGKDDAIPENATCFINFSYLAYMFIENLITSFTITYDGVDYVYDSTNVQIIQGEEEPDAPTLYSAVFTAGGAGNTVTTSEYTLGDNLVASNENDGTSLSPALLLLTSEQAQNMSVSVTTIGNSSSSISPEMIQNFVDSMSVKELTNFADVDVSSISSFISEHNITHVVSFMNVYDCFAPSIQGTSDEVLSSFTITYNGNPYVYGFDSFTFNMGQ